jgi:hypothetical protein
LFDKFVLKTKGRKEKMMKKDSKTSIPLISFTSSRERWEPGKKKEKFFFLSDSYTRISLPKELPDSCYGVKIEEACHPPILPSDCLAVFSTTEGMPLKNIYAVGVQDEMPFVGKWILKERYEGIARVRRKVFMVPTPMHLPDSQVSPIAPCLHQTFLFKDFASPDKLRLIPVNKILWKHPLVYVHK